MKTLQAFSVLVLLVLVISACTKKEEKKQEEPDTPAERTEPLIPEAAPDSRLDSTQEAPEEASPAEASAEEVASEEEAAKPAPLAKPQVDPNIISQRLQTYQTDLEAMRAKINKYAEVQARFSGDDEEFDQKFLESRQAFNEEAQRFAKLLTSIKKDPTRIQWESKEREWADEWRHVLRAFNDIEALYEKQYEGLK